MIKTLNHIIEFIEVHLCEDITLEMIANEAGVSDYHFRKIFFFLTGATLSEYIRMRRLSEAGKDLLSGMKVTDVAFKYGYESIDGFTRSFKAWSTTLPSDVYRTKTCTLYPKVSFSISVSGGINMQYRIVEKPAFHLAGVTKRVPMQFEGVNQEIVKLAQSITERQREELHRIQNVEPKKVVNASYEADAVFSRQRHVQGSSLKPLQYRPSHGLCFLVKDRFPGHCNRQWRTSTPSGSLRPSMSLSMLQIFLGRQWMKREADTQPVRFGLRSNR